jgi:cytochrome c oxidase subunit I+III
MYTPLSSRTFTPGINADFWLIGVTFVEVSAICAAVEIVVSILKVSTGGMALHRMPLMAWYLLVTAFMMLGGFPPLILGSILLEIERAFDWPFFDAARGGDPLLWQHLFWLFGHPEVYIIFLPAAGVVSTVIPVFARRPIVGYTWIVCAIVALAFLSFGLWVHHMYTVGLPHMAIAFFSAASMLVAVPTGVQIFAWLATLITGRPELKLPMLYILGFFFVFVAGWAHRRHGRRRAVRLAGTRHALHRRAPALRAGRRLRLPDAGGGLLLAAADDRAGCRSIISARSPSG